MRNRQRRLRIRNDLAGTMMISFALLLRSAHATYTRGEHVRGDLAGHRDEALNTQDGDDIFGGWINFDDQSQHFSCVPGTRIQLSKQNHGFAKIKDTNQVTLYRQLANANGEVEIPPGHILAAGTLSRPEH